MLECPAEQNWKSWKCCILSTAEAVLGQGKKRQPDWFIQAADMLQPLYMQYTIRCYTQTALQTGKSLRDTEEL